MKCDCISTLYTPDYATYTAAMLANATKYSNSIEQTAYANLQYGNDSSGSNSLLVTSANMRAITGNSAYAGGVNASGQVVSAGTTTGTYDGVITLNAADISGFGGSGTTSPGRVIQHEVDEVLGIGGSGSTLGSSQQATTTGGNYGVTDLFRYSVNHTPSYTTSSNATSYFSINGGQTNIVNFNQNPGGQQTGGDFGDWSSEGNTGNYVQLAFTSASDGAASVSLTSPEGIALQAVGYDAATPEPAPLALMATALGAIAVFRLRRRPNAPGFAGRA